MKDLIERLRAKPEHERKRIAIVASVGTTALITLVWATATLSSGTLALKPQGGAGLGAAHSASSDTASGESGFPNLLGAVAAFQKNASSPAALKIEDVTPAKPSASGPDTRTVIPF